METLRHVLSLELFPNNFLIIFKQISRLPKSHEPPA
jgi:hypothetical protein